VTPEAFLEERFGRGREAANISVPGRVNLIGEHIDYHNLPVLPMAIQRRIRIAFRPRADRRIRATTAEGFGDREFKWRAPLEPGPSGDWANYIKAAARAVDTRWDLPRGIDAAVVSDLPHAAGLSSSSALLTGFTLALLQANGVSATFDELMEILPEGEHFVGTRGGGMDHAAVLAAKPGHALLVRFVPLGVTQVPIPPDWSILVAHSLVTAEKSGAVRAEYNSRRVAGTHALERLGFASYESAIAGRSFAELEAMAQGLDKDERGAFTHVAGEALRVDDAVEALRAGDAARFGRALNDAHASARDRLRISCPELDTLVEIARETSAFGARLTGAGFGGFAVIACHASDRDRIASEIRERYYAGRKGFDPNIHLIAVEPSAGALRT
jgi:galactokinase